MFSSLTADFSASDSTFCQGTSVTFTDLSTGTPTSWAWDFGDGNTSSLQNPTHTYASVGTYDVSLTVTTSSGSDSETKTGFININCLQRTYVPDDNFEAYLETHDANGNVVAVGASNSMGDGIANNDSVTTANISGVTNLDVIIKILQI